MFLMAQALYTIKQNLFLLLSQHDNSTHSLKSFKMLKYSLLSLVLHAATIAGDTVPEKAVLPFILFYFHVKPRTKAD